jgi:hypothetical protein
MCTTKLSTFIVVLLAGLVLSGCPKPGYMGVVDAYVSQQQVDRIRTAWLGLGGFEGPRHIEGGNPNCSSYVKRLSPSNTSVSVNDCQEPWGYRVTVLTWQDGRRPEVKAEVDALVEEIRRVIQAQAPDAKVMKGQLAVAMPF